MNRILLAGGGSLGSVSPLVAIIENFPEADFLFLITKSGPEGAFLRERGIRTMVIPAGKLRRYFSWRNFTDIFFGLAGFVRSLYIIQNYQPDIILSAGGFSAVPVVFAGRLLGKKIFVHQQDLQLGLANKLMAPLATTITISFPEQQRFFSPTKTVYTGNPCRQLTSVGSQELEQSIVILGGSLGARGLNSFVNKIVPDLARNYRVEHILGKQNGGQALPLKKNYRVWKFVDKELPELLASASLIITRAGMSTITELATLRKPIIIIPMPNSHQEVNAKFFASQQGALVVNEGDTPALTSAITGLMTEPLLAHNYGQRLGDICRPGAVDNYLHLIKKTIHLEVEKEPLVYLSGIGGIGLSALAYYFLREGYGVMGSDLTANRITERLEQKGVKIFYQQNKKNLPPNLKIFLYSSALPANHEELVEAKRRHIPVYSYNEYLGLLTQKKSTVAISGTHGKTTTTGLVGYIAAEAGLDPTVIVGGLIPQFDGNFRPGTSDLMIVEACEYRSHLLNLRPKMAVITNIDEDHLDYFIDLKHIQSQFQKFVDLLPPDGVLIRNLDDHNSQVIKSNVKELTFGIQTQAQFMAKNIQVADSHQSFELYINNEKVDTIELQIPGKFNIYNALASIAVAYELQVDLAVTKECLKLFRGSWRRFEKVGLYKEIPVYSDYAHHPTEIQSTIEAAQRFYPERKLFVVFQPHSYSRTENLFDRFSQSFSLADTVIITQTYKVAGREDDVEEVQLAKRLSEKIEARQVFYAESFKQTEEIIDANLKPDQILIFMGAGDIDILARKISARDRH